MVSSSAQPGLVYLVGAGPGDPGLLTLRALHLLESAEVILPDDLVSDEALALANPSALIIPVGKRCGQPRITQAGIHALMLEHASAGRSVLRLKSGDPLVFGRAGEEIAFLRQANIPFEVVPGITAAFAVAATLKTPLTDRSSASKLIFTTAHHAAPGVRAADDGREQEQKQIPFGNDKKKWWEGELPPDATLVVYMPGRNFRTLADELIASGIDGTTPCVAVSKASTPDEHIHATTLAELEDASVGPAPVLLLIGHAIQPAARSSVRQRGTA